MVTVLGLNVSAPTPERARELLAYLWLREERVLVLTEMTGGAGSRLMLQVCEAAGYVVIAPPLKARDRGCVVIVRDADLQVGTAEFPEGPRVVRVPIDGVTLIGVYGVASDPVRYSGSAQRDRKRARLARFTDLVAGETDSAPILIIGDLNIVDPDDRDRLPYVLAEERAAYDRLLDLDLGFVDAYRAATGTTSITWSDHSGVGCRYDHVFARGLRIVGAEIDDTPRLDGHTDHSAIAVDVTAVG